MNHFISMTIEFHDEDTARQFTEALTGHDDDVCLAMEKAAKAHLGVSLAAPVYLWVDDEDKIKAFYAKGVAA